MINEEKAGEAFPATDHAVAHPEEAPQFVKVRAEWDTIFLLEGQAEYEDWLAWHFAIILGRRHK